AADFQQWDIISGCHVVQETQHGKVCAVCAGVNASGVRGTGFLVPFLVDKFRAARLHPLPLYSGGEGGVRGDRLPCWMIMFSRGMLTPLTPAPLPPSTGGEGRDAQQKSDECDFLFSSAHPGP